MKNLRLRCKTKVRSYALYPEARGSPRGGRGASPRGGGRPRLRVPEPELPGAPGGGRTGSQGTGTGMAAAQPGAGGKPLARLAAAELPRVAAGGLQTAPEAPRNLGLNTASPAHRAQHEALAGAWAGVLGTVLGFPLDTMKTRMQAGGRGFKTGTLGTAGKILAEEGFWGFYRGISSPLVALTWLNTVNFSTYSRLKSHFDPDACADPYRRAARIAAAGFLVGPVTSSQSTPFEVVKVQMQLDSLSGERNKFRSTPHAVQKIVRRHGVATLWTGFGVNCLRESMFFATYFFTYEHLKGPLTHALPEGYDRLATPVAGGLSGVAAWNLTFPLDTVKANVQRQVHKKDRLGNKVRVSSGWQIWKKILRERGVVGLYSGVWAASFRAFFVSATRFTAYEQALHFLQRDQ